MTTDAPSRLSLGRAVCEWIEENCVYPSGEFMGQPFVLLPWQREWIYELYRCDSEGELQYRWALLGVPKKAGKALSLDTPLPTPHGWVRMGDVRPGQTLFDERGQPCNVVAVGDVQHDRPCYNVRFSDGTHIDADAEHEWYTETLKPEYGRGIKTTREIAETRSTRTDGAANHTIPVAGLLQTDDCAWLPIAPYVLGAWLGDGTSSGGGMTSGDPEMREHFQAEGYEVSEFRRYSFTPYGLQVQLRAAGLLRNKHIPQSYLRAGVGQRLALLQGLMDTDGHATPRGQGEFTSTNERLADGVVELARTLGLKPRKREGVATLNGRVIGPKWRVNFYAFADMPVFRLRRKYERQKAVPMKRTRSQTRQIIGADPIPSVPVRCIEVDSPSHLYLAGEGMVPTHNSSMAAALALYHLLGDPNEIDPWVCVAAASDKQADIVFNAAKRMCEYSPTLRDVTERYRWEIQPKDGAGKLERVAASGGKLDGKNISMLIVDELHEWQQDNWTILTNGTVGRRRAQIIQITTAGWDQESICYTEYEKGRRIEAGEVENPSYFFKWYGLPENADHRDEALWPDMNPSFGVLVHVEQLRDKLINVPESEWRRYFGNQWVEAENLWLPAGAWDDCGVESVVLRADVPTFIGWDASTKYDSTAIVAAQEVDERYVVKAWVWERPLDPNGDPVADWSVPGAEIANMLRDLWRHKLNVQSIAFDPAFITWLAQELTTEGLPMFEWPQTDNRMVPATQAAYEAVIKGIVAHDGDPVLARHIRSALAVQTSRGGQRLTKGRTKRKIDAAVALLMALDMLKRQEPPRSAAASPAYSTDTDGRPEMAGVRDRQF